MQPRSNNVTQPVNWDVLYHERSNKDTPSFKKWSTLVFHWPTQGMSKKLSIHYSNHVTCSIIVCFLYLCLFGKNHSRSLPSSCSFLLHVSWRQCWSRFAFSSDFGNVNILPALWLVYLTIALLWLAAKKNNPLAWPCQSFCGNLMKITSYQPMRNLPNHRDRESFHLVFTALPCPMRDHGTSMVFCCAIMP